MNIESGDKFDKSTIMILRCGRTMEAPDNPPSCSVILVFQLFFAIWPRQEGFEMFPSLAEKACRRERKKLIFLLFRDKTIKTFASCFGAHFTHSLSGLLCVRREFPVTLPRLLTISFLHTLPTLLSSRRPESSQFPLRY